MRQRNVFARPPGSDERRKADRAVGPSGLVRTGYFKVPMRIFGPCRSLQDSNRAADVHVSMARNGVKNGRLWSS